MRGPNVHREAELRELELRSYPLDIERASLHPEHHGIQRCKPARWLHSPSGQEQLSTTATAARILGLVTRALGMGPILLFSVEQAIAPASVQRPSEEP